MWRSGAALIGFMLRQFEISRLVGIRPCLYCVSGLSLFLFLSFSSTLWVNRVRFFAPSFRVSAIFRFLLFLQFPQLDPESISYDGCGRYPRRCIAFCDPWCYSREPLYEDGEQSNTFKAFQSDQEEETYSMVTANRFWSQIFGIAFSNKRWLHFFMLFVPVVAMDFIHWYY